MSLLRQMLYGGALLGALGLLLWVQQQRIDLAQARLGQAELARKASDALLSRQTGTITALEAALSASARPRPIWTNSGSSCARRWPSANA